MIYYAQDLVNRPPLSSSEVNWFAPKVGLSSFTWMVRFRHQVYSSAFALLRNDFKNSRKT